MALQRDSRIFEFNSTYTANERLFIGEAFDSILLPFPEENESFTTNECGNLLFINCAAVTVRIDKKSFLPWKGNHSMLVHDHIMQPIGTWESGDLLINIYPGLKTPALQAVDEQDEIFKREESRMKSLKKILAGDGYNLRFFSAHLYNIGYIPQTQTDEWPHGHPVLLDLGEMSISAKVYALAHTKSEPLKSPYSAPIQDRQYGDLRHAFNHAVQGRHKDILEFWRLCSDAQKQGRLKASWIKVNSPQYRETLPKIAANYTQKFVSALNF